MDNNDEKIIEYLSQHKSILWTSILVLGGGVVGLILTYNPMLYPNSFGNFTRIILFIIGLTLIFSMIIGVLNVDSEILKYLKKRRST